MQQGTVEWHEARLAKITASRFGEVLKKGTKGEMFGKVAWSYAYELVAEKLTGTWKEISARPMEWGKANEPMARKMYMAETFDYVQEVGFVDYIDMIGCSPDGLIGDDGCLEIKCPWDSANHVRALETKQVPEIYVPQVQGQLMCLDRKWCNFVSYDPRFKDISKRIIFIPVYRDEEYIKILLNRLNEFKKIVKSILEKIK